VMDTDRVVELLGLSPHPEGGFYKEVFRDRARVTHPIHGRERSAMTVIYFLLPSGTFSALHRVAQSEGWHHLDGEPVDLHVIEGGVHGITRLGTLEYKQHVVPAHAWQAAVPVGERWSLCGCTVAPGFDFEDFEMPTRDELLAILPAHRDLVVRLTR
jgi:predicted cupin superfamily sugar epimerase